MTASECNDKVLEKFTNNITDRVFLMIQSDRELMEDYLNLLKGNERNVINSEMAKAIKSKFHLENGAECDSPESLLIKSYTKFNLP